MEGLKQFFPVRVIYVYAMAILFVILGACFWFIFHYIFWIIQPVASGITVQFNANGTEWNQVDAFFQAYDAWALILALLCMMLFVFVYSQRRGRTV